MILKLPRDVRKRLHKVVRKAGRREVGGVLMGEQLEPGCFRLIDFSVDSETGSAAHFVRSVEHHQTALSAFFESTGGDYARFNYLGEWHSHPSFLPVPSSEDVRSMVDLVNSQRDIPFAVLLIMRAGWRRLACSATLFQQTGGPSSVSVEIE
jgi:integrative and conjugative element protein (TIGR02256 family)